MRDCKNQRDNLCRHDNLRNRCMECKIFGLREKERIARLESRECEWCMEEVLRWETLCTGEELQRMVLLLKEEKEKEREKEGAGVGKPSKGIEGVNLWKVRYAYLLKHGFL